MVFYKALLFSCFVLFSYHFHFALGKDLLLLAMISTDFLTTSHAWRAILKTSLDGKFPNFAHHCKKMCHCDWLIKRWMVSS